MDILHALILGIVEGITEFLPVSSTGHLILASSLLGIPNSDFLKLFEIVIQLGAILAVVALYWKRFLEWELLKRLFVAFLPTGVIGLALYHVVKMYLLGNELVVLLALGIGGAALIIFEIWHTDSPEAVAEGLHDITYRQSALIGLAQSLAIIPGVSRSAATIVGGLWLGLSRPTIVEFSFLLAVPTMTAATGLDVLKNLSLFTADATGTLAVGFITSFIVALIAIRLFLGFVRTHTFIPFGIYRIIVSLAFLIFIFVL